MLFGMSHRKKTRYGAVIDIGSGSVLVAIIGTSADSTHPDIIWSKREYTTLRQIDSIAQSAKSVMTSLMSAIMLLNSEGREVFKTKTGHSDLPETQVTISAPWSYTVTKSISYKHDEEFKVSEDLVAELLRTAHQKIAEELKENEQVHKLGLSVISRSMTGLLANGYNLKRASGQLAKTLNIFESSAIAQQYLITAVSDARDKVLTDTELRLYSFILVYYSIIRDLYPETTEYCLVDITYEATEIGIVRNGILQYSTHTPYGSFSIAREIANVLEVPLEEAFSYLQEENLSTHLANYSATKQEEIETIFTNYQERVAQLFHETGDNLATPKKIFLHGNLYTEPFFKKHIATAAKAATKSSHAIYPISAELLTRHYAEAAEAIYADKDIDTALLISAQFFHNVGYQDKFEQL